MYDYKIEKIIEQLSEDERRQMVFKIFEGDGIKNFPFTRHESLQWLLGFVAVLGAWFGMSYKFHNWVFCIISLGIISCLIWKPEKW